MHKNAPKIIKKIVLILVSIFIVLSVANWYLKYRLENYLRTMLSEKVAEATKGVYKLDFDHLSIGLISGELLIEGINLRPDSTNHQDSFSTNKKLEQYIELKVGSIYFKGLNLTWRTNYKKLHFNLFQIKNADINVYNKALKKTTEDKPLNNESLYEMISPYINVLHVDKISLENSAVNYRFYDSDGSYSKYSLEDINFEANNFLLDENSEKSGKLLYSENFNFHVNKPQRLISNGQFSLQTDRMIFDTKDSIIEIRDVQLIPKKRFWERVNQLPESYIEGKVNSIKVKGLFFTRHDGKTDLIASIFDINNPAIEYFETNKDPLQKKQEKATNDTLNLSWSLYSIISPIFNKVEIKNIGVNDAKFKYSQSLEKDTNVYTLDTLNLIALNFVVDSLSQFGLEKRFLYSEGFGLRANGIKAFNAEKNYIISANEMALNTIERIFRMKDISLKPIDTNTKDDYIIGNVASISIDELEYNKGLDANLLNVESPNLEYVRIASVKEYEDSQNKKIKVDNGANIWQQVSPFFNHLLVKEIQLNNGILKYTDKTNKNTYRLNGLYFNASNLLIDQQTIDLSSYMSAFENLDFGFDRFDGTWTTQKHHIETQRTSFSTRTQNLRIEKLKLIPIASNKNTNNVMNISLPLIDFKGLQFKFDSFYPKNLKVKSLDIISPNISIIEGKKKNTTNNGNKVSIPQTPSVIENIDLTKLTISNGNIRYISDSNKDTLSSKLNKLEISKLEWKVGNNINLDKIFLSSLNLDIANYASNKKDEKQKGNGSSDLDNHLYKGININTFEVENSHLNLRDQGKTVELSLPSFILSNLEWDKDLFHLYTMDVKHPFVGIVRDASIDTIVKIGADQKKDNIYKKLGGLSNLFRIERVNISDVNFDYSFLLKDSPTKNHHLNKTNIYLSGLEINNIEENYNIEDIDLDVKNFHYPSHYGFYSLQVSDIHFSNKSNLLKLDSIRLIPAYPKLEFAYKDPRNSDWFDITVGNAALSGIDVKKYIKTSQLFADSLTVNYVLLQNFKNQNIKIKHNVMPMIYEALQDSPLKLSINQANVNDFNVIYEELPKNGKTPSTIIFNNMNGRLRGLTNIETQPNQFIELLADGRFMNTGNFKARWMIPVSKNYDCFEIDAQMQNFELSDLNPIIEPMAPVTVSSGIVKDVTFNIEGSSLGAQVDMLMLYNDLNVTIQKGMDNSNTNTFLTKISNAIIRTNNPNKPKSKPRHPDLYVERDPYHSTFNYLWQILQPPLVESVGISQGKQNFLKKASGLITSIKKFFKREKKEVKGDPKKEKKKEQGN